MAVIDTERNRSEWNFNRANVLIVNSGEKIHLNKQALPFYSSFPACSNEVRKLDLSETRY